MSTINNHHALFVNDIDLNNSIQSEKEASLARQIYPGSSVIEATIEQIQINSQNETMEMMGLRIGEYYKQLQNMRSERSKNLLMRLILKNQEKDGFNGLLNKNFSEDANSDLFLAQQIFKTGYLLTQHGDNPLRRRALSKQLEDLMEEQGWQIALFGALEFHEMTKPSGSHLKRLFQEVMDDEEYSVINFFEKIKEWPDRKRRIKVLLRAMAFELNLQTVSKKGQRLKIMIDRLRRLLLFLGLDEYCAGIGSAYQLEGDVVLSEVLEITAQSWVFNDWLEERLEDLHLKNKQKYRFIVDLTRTFKTMPDGCFCDDDHREQILEVLSSLFILGSKKWI